MMPHKRRNVKSRRHVEKEAKKQRLYPMKGSPLLQAIIAKHPISEILDLIDREPKSVKLPGNKESYPLHEACRHISRNKGNIIMKLLEMFPQAARFKDAEGLYPLHIACLKRQPDDVILKLMELHPEAAAEAALLRGSVWLYPLQLVCQYYGYSENVVMALAHIYPAALQTKYDQSRYPIHHLFVNKRSLEIIEFFINLDQSVIHQTDKLGKTPLHYAIENENMIDVVEYLLELPDIPINKQDNSGNTPLHVACIRGNPTAVAHLLRHEQKIVQLRNAKGSYPLHEACRRIKRNEGNVIVKLLELFPQTAQFQDAEGRYPLHIACRHRQPDDVIVKLIKIHPEAAATQLPDASESYPLHVACKCISNDEGNIITTLLEVFPQAAQFQDADGWYPLHIACRWYKPDDVILKLVEVHPEAAAAQFPDAKGSYPLHVLCRNGGYYRRNNSNGLLKLLEVFPQAAKFHDAKGWYPLHMACNSHHARDDVILKLIEIHPEAAAVAALHDGSCWQYPLQLLWFYDNKNVIRTLAHMYPAALHVKNEISDYPVHRAFRNHRALEIIKIIINLDPTVIHQANRDGDTPLHQACFRKHMIDEVEYLLKLSDLNINATNNRGDSPLHIAIDCGSFDIVDALLRHPFLMINQRNHNNETPFDLVDKKISRLQNLYVYDHQRRRLPKYQQIKRQLEDHLQMTRWGSYEYLYRNVMDGLVNQ